MQSSIASSRHLFSETKDLVPSFSRFMILCWVFIMLWPYTLCDLIRFRSSTRFMQLMKDILGTGASLGQSGASLLAKELNMHFFLLRLQKQAILLVSTLGYFRYSTFALVVDLPRETECSVLQALQGRGYCSGCSSSPSLYLPLQAGNLFTNLFLSLQKVSLLAESILAHQLQNSVVRYSLSSSKKSILAMLAFSSEHGGRLLADSQGTANAPGSSRRQSICLMVVLAKC